MFTLRLQFTPNGNQPLILNCLGKYALLLHAMSKQCSSEDQKNLRDAEELVKFQLRHGNDLLTMDSIRDCDVNLKEQGNLLRQVTALEVTCSKLASASRSFS